MLKPAPKLFGSVEERVELELAYERMPDLDKVPLWGPEEFAESIGERTYDEWRRSPGTRHLVGQVQYQGEAYKDWVDVEAMWRLHAPHTHEQYLETRTKIIDAITWRGASTFNRWEGRTQPQDLEDWGNVRGSLTEWTISPQDRSEIYASFNRLDPRPEGKTPQSFLQAIITRLSTEYHTGDGPRLKKPFDLDKVWGDFMHNETCAAKAARVEDAIFPDEPDELPFVHKYARQAVIAGTVHRMSELLRDWRGTTYPQEGDRNAKANLRTNLRDYIPGFYGLKPHS